MYLDKNLASPVIELSKATGDVGKRIAEQNLELFNANYEMLTNQLKRLSDVKKPEEYLALQKDIISENLTNSMDNLHKIINLGIQNVEDIARIWNSTATKISEKAVEKAQKVSEKSQR